MTENAIYTLDNKDFFVKTQRNQTAAELTSKYQIHWYRKKLIKNAINKLNIVNWRTDPRVRKLNEIFDKHVLQYRLVYQIDQRYSLGGNITANENETFTVWNAESGEFIFPDSTTKRISGYTRIHTFGDYSFQRTLMDQVPATKIDSLLLLPLEIDQLSPFYEKKFCFTGKSAIKRELLEYLTNIFGAVFQNAVTKETNYLVTPTGGPATPTPKLKKIIERNANLAKDLQTEIIDEVTFIKNLPNLDETEDLTKYLL